MKASMCSLSCLTEVNDASLSELPCRIENQISTGRGEVEMYVGMTLEPAVVFRLMGVEIVEDDI